MEKKMIPYSLYLPVDVHGQLRDLAKHRKAATLVREAIEMFLNGKDLYASGYNKGIEDAAKVVFDCEEAQMIAIKGRDMGVVLRERITELMRK
jgi:predicted DNA-binding protein